MTDKQNKWSSASKQASKQAEEDPLVAIARIRAQEQQEIAESVKKRQEMDAQHLKKMQEMRQQQSAKLDAIRKRRRW